MITMNWSLFLFATLGISPPFAIRRNEEVASSTDAVLLPHEWSTSPQLREVATLEDVSSYAKNTIALTLQRFGVSNAPPPTDDFTETASGAGSFSHDGGWFFRTYNDAGYLNWKYKDSNEDDLEDGNVDGSSREFLRVEYRAEQSEEWGGFVDVGRVLINRNRRRSDTATAGRDYLGYAANLYNCLGTVHIRLRYRIKSPQSIIGRAHLRLILLDGSDYAGDAKNNEDGTNIAQDDVLQNLENWYSFNYILDGDNGSERWQELILPWTSFDRPGWSGQVGNDRLDIDAIHGWRIEISIDSQGEINSTSSGVIDIDSLSCVGSPNDGSAIIDSPFRYGENGNNRTFRDAVANGVWSEHHYQSPISRERSSAYILPNICTLMINYTVEQTEERGGFVAYSHVSPGFYNLTAAEALSLDYEVIQPASVLGRAHVRLILLDGSNCTNNSDNDGRCDAHPGLAIEHYYSFNYILDGGDDASRGSITVPLIGDASPDSPFYRVGWAGFVGNNVLNKCLIRGFILEINVDSSGEIGSLVSGMVALGNLTAIFPSDEPAIEDSIGAILLVGGGATDTKANDIPEAKCVLEPDLHFSINPGTSFYRRIEFVGSKCCDICKDDDQCLFFHDNGRDCFLSSGLDSTAVQLANTEFIRSTTASYWIDDSLKLGDFCSVCFCDKERALIDCGGQNLTITPKVFNQGWKPEVLDLRDNPRLLILGEHTFQSLSSTLKEIYLPREMMFISPEAFMGLSETVRIEFEDREADDESVGLLNVISNKIESFGDVCCSLSVNAALAQGLAFCELEVFVPGIDAAYMPFIQHFNANQLQEIRPTSSFMSEAAESPEMCAEYCAINSRCQYFSYDARWKESEHRCYLLESNGTRSEEICCDPDDYGDEQGTIPGWTSGWPARTRHREYDAKVKFSSNHLEASEQNSYETSYDISLGSGPSRGGVWVEPTVRRKDGFEVSITPQRVVLYDASTTVTVRVSVSNVDDGSGMTIVVQNMITSCDAAFVSADLADLAYLGDVYIKIQPPKQNLVHIILTATLIPLFLAILFGVIGCLIVNKKRLEADSVWKINPKELNFKPEPEILGRGTFGLVILAEYRGTQVAVKRVIPPGNDSRGSQSSLLSIFQFDTTLNRKKLEEVDLAFNRSADPNVSLFKDVDNDSLSDVEDGQEKRPNNDDRVRSLSGTLPGFFPVSYKYDKPNTMFRTKQSLRSKLRNNFIKEMRILSRLRHPNITTVMGAIIKNGIEPALVMEFMDRGSLYDLLHNETMIIEGELLLPLLCDIAKGVRFLHSAEPKVIHGDLKSANILVDGRFRAKVADFGLTQKKQAGRGVGTPYWMAPEILNGGCNTGASDVYSFGIILYEVYSRKDPYEGEDYNEVLKSVADPNVSKHPQAPTSMPPLMNSLMAQCLQYSDEKRPSFQDIDQRLRDLDADMVEPEEANIPLQTRSSYRRALNSVFPPKIAKYIREGKKVEPESREMVTIFFSDVVGFTEIASKLSPLKISDMLDRLYSKFDELSEAHDVFKVETIGDAYMAVTNLITDQYDHAKRIARFAIDTIKAAKETPIDIDNPSLGNVNIRVGFHSGPCVANVVGRVNPRYCLFGDTVNTSSRMESNSESGRIHCSDKTAALLHEQCPEIPLLCRGIISVKGKGEMRTYWVNERPCRKRGSISKRPKVGPYSESKKPKELHPRP